MRLLPIWGRRQPASLRADAPLSPGHGREFQDRTQCHKKAGKRNTHGEGSFSFPSPLFFFARSALKLVNSESEKKETALARANQNPIVDFGLKLRGARLAARRRQIYVAEISGTDQPYVSHVEKGKVNPTIEICINLARAVGCIYLAELHRGRRKDAELDTALIKDLTLEDCGKFAAALGCSFVSKLTFDGPR
jgi:transcriptional regulator with XRE-family HTH domain